MRRPLVSLALAAASLLSLPPAGAAEAQSVRRFETALSQRVGYSYLEYLPPGYAAEAGRRWPLLLFLHGAGERGGDVRLVAKHGPPKLLEGSGRLTEAEAAARRQLAANFIVISPQCPPGEVWDEDGLVALLDHVCAELRVDRSRVYLTGLSMGGYGTWELALKHPGRFAAAVPICGGGRLLEVLISRGARREAIQSLPVRAFHGAKDFTVPLSESERVVETLRRIGASQVGLTIYPEAGHDSWTETYASPELYEWLLRHRRDPAPEGGAPK